METKKLILKKDWADLIILLETTEKFELDIKIELDSEIYRVNFINSKKEGAYLQVSQYSDLIKVLQKYVSIPKNQGANLRITSDILEQILIYEKDLEKKKMDTQKIFEDKIKNNEIKIKLRYYEGEYLSGMMFDFDYEANYVVTFPVLTKIFMENLAGKDVSGWGFHIEQKVSDTLGKEFFYTELVNLQKEKIETKLKKEIDKKMNIENIFKQAKETGKKVEIEHFAVDCNDPHEDCSTDIITVWAMPDGTKTESRNHTW